MRALWRRIQRSLLEMGWSVSRVPRVDPAIPDSHLYRPMFSPWTGAGEFGELYALVRDWTLVSSDRAWVLWTLARQALALEEGEFWECGVYRGGTAALLAETLSRRRPGSEPSLRLFDTFAGMPEVNRAFDLHHTGDFADTSVSAVRQRVGERAFVSLHPGLIPVSFEGLGASRIALAHVDLDIYQSVRDAVEFIYPRLVSGGLLIFDDYGFPSCPGARRAVDEFFAATPEVPLVLETGQALVLRLPR